MNFSKIKLDTFSIIAITLIMALSGGFVFWGTYALRGMLMEGMGVLYWRFFAILLFLIYPAIMSWYHFIISILMWITIGEKPSFLKKGKL